MLQKDISRALFADQKVMNIGIYIYLYHSYTV